MSEAYMSSLEREELVTMDDGVQLWTASRRSPSATAGRAGGATRGQCRRWSMTSSPPIVGTSAAQAARRRSGFTVARSADLEAATHLPPVESGIGASPCALTHPHQVRGWPISGPLADQRGARSLPRGRCGQRPRQLRFASCGRGPQRHGDGGDAMLAGGSAER
jgi:hypothetical protein